MKYLFLLLLTITSLSSTSQPQLEPWGNLSGILVDGQLLECNTSIQTVDANGQANATWKERQTPKFTRNGDQRIVSTRLDSLYLNEIVTSAGPGAARFIITASAHADIDSKVTYFTLDFPAGSQSKDFITFIDAGNTSLDQLSTLHNASFGANAKGITIHSQHRELELHLDQPALISGFPVTIANKNYIRINIPLHLGEWHNGQSAGLGLKINLTGDIDHGAAHLAINTNSPGRTFDGLGGNFRIQNTRLDPQVIDYCLQHLDIAWGRVELPWRFWQPQLDSHPLDSAKAGHLDPAVQRAMEMARKLGDKHIPIILSAWFPPQWAVEGPLRFRPGADHIWGNPLNHANDQAIYQSITDYILFLKAQYKVDIAYFSFNESDLGINVRQTPKEHATLIKELGAYFAAHKLSTKVLLGDNSDATTYNFIDDASNDPAAKPYISAISFHSWRGWDTATLQKWSDAATKLRVPLLVGEGSIDAAAWNYPAIFQEPAYALKEIDLYTRLLAVCQPASILQWQLTADYSLLAGGGIFGDTGTLRPTQRFANLKQLSLTPKGLAAMPITVDRPNLTVAALGDNARHIYALHLVNTGASREVELTGLPAKVKILHAYITNQTASVKEGPSIPIVAGTAHFTIEAQSYLTLISDH